MVFPSPFFEWFSSFKSYEKSGTHKRIALMMFYACPRGEMAPALYKSLPQSMQSMTPVLVPWLLPLVFGIALATGIISGFYPARKASRMDPMVALRRTA